MGYQKEKSLHLRVVLEVIPAGILKELPNTIFVNLAGAFCLLLFYYLVVKINRKKSSLPDPSLVCEFFKRDTNFGPVDADLLWNPALLKAINQQYVWDSLLISNDVQPFILFVIVAFVNEAAYASKTIRAKDLSC